MLVFKKLLRRIIRVMNRWVCVINSSAWSFPSRKLGHVNVYDTVNWITTFNFNEIYRIFQTGCGRLVFEQLWALLFCMTKESKNENFSEICHYVVNIRKFYSADYDISRHAVLCKILKLITSYLFTDWNCFYLSMS